MSSAFIIPTSGRKDQHQQQKKAPAERGTRVFAKRLQPPCVIHQACVGHWTLDTTENSVEVVFGKNSYLSLHRFTPDTTATAGDGRPSGTFELVHEQPVLGVIKDMKTFQCRFEPEAEYSDNHMDIDGEGMIEEPVLGVVPMTATSNLLVCTSDSGVLSFLAYHNKPNDDIPTISDFATNSTSTGRFVIVKEVSIATLGTDVQSYGARLAIDPTSRVIATSSMQGNIKLFFMRSTKRSAFDPIERETEIVLLKGTIIQMEFLVQDPEEVDNFVDLAVLFFDTDLSQHRIATFHICMNGSTTSNPEFHVGQSFVSSDATLAPLHLKALPNYPKAMAYVDEEKITLVTIPKALPTTHTHHPPLYLLKRDLPSSSPEERSASTSSTSYKNLDEYPFISACASSPATAHSTDEQILYLGTHTAEIYRVNINTGTNQMHFEMVSGERSVGKVMMVLAKQSSIQQESERNGMEEEEGATSTTICSTDYLLYSNDQGDGGLLAVQEDRDGGVNLFAIEALQSISPVLDFCAREPSIPGRDCLYVCNGMREEGSVTRIRSGVATESSASSNNPYFAGTVGLWGFALNEADEVDSFLVMSFIQSTKVMFNGEGESLEDISVKSGFNLSQATLLAGRIYDGAIFQVHRAGVIVAWPHIGRTYTWECEGEVIAAADLVSPGVIILGIVSEHNQSSLKLLHLQQSEADEEEASAKFHVLATATLNDELTTIYCWSRASFSEDGQEVNPPTRYCCIGTLEPSLVVFSVNDKSIREIYRESLAQDRHDRVTIPQSLAIVGAPPLTSAEPSKQSYRMLVGLRDGTMLSYGWHPSSSCNPTSRSSTKRLLSLPQLFKIGILPVKFVTSHSSRQTLSAAPSSVLIQADRIWRADMRRNRLEINAVLFDGGEVSQTCSFRYAGPDSEATSCFAFIVDHSDLQLVTVGQPKAFNYHSTMVLGETPRRILDITSKKLLMVATVGNKFPAEESRLKLFDPDRPWTESTADVEGQQQVEGTSGVEGIPEFKLKKGEMVCCMVEWKIPRANKADAVYICIGTAQFSSSTLEKSSSLGIPKTGRLVALSIKQNKKAERKDRRFEIELRWAMAMQAPVFAISPFMEKYNLQILIFHIYQFKWLRLFEKLISRSHFDILDSLLSFRNLLVSVGPYLKLLALDLAKKTLVERASYRERWPISHISSVGNHIFTGSRKESITLYEYEPSIGDHPESLRFLKSARAARMIADCYALSDELAVATDMSGGIFGLGYLKDDPSCQHSLKDEFSFHLGEVISRIRIAKLWPPTVERSMRGIVLSQDHGGKNSQDVLEQSTALGITPLITFQQMMRWVVRPWTASTVISESRTESSDASPQALVACSHLGSIWGFWRLEPAVYRALLRLQQTLQTLYHTRPLLGQAHDRFRSISGPLSNVIDGELMLQFLNLELALQLEVLEQSVGIHEYLQQWLAYGHATAEERQVFDGYARILASKYPLAAKYVLARSHQPIREGGGIGSSLYKGGHLTLSLGRQGHGRQGSSEISEGCSGETSDESKLWWTFGAVHNLLEFLKVLNWHQ